MRSGLRRQSGTLTLLTAGALLTGATVRNWAAVPPELVARFSSGSGVAVLISDNFGELPLELARSQRYLIRHVCPTRSAVTDLRARAIEQQTYGLIASEYLPRLSTLPYADELVNVVLVADPSTLAAKGLGFHEVNRVLAPLGQVWIPRTGTLGKSVAAGWHDRAAELGYADDPAFAGTSNPYRVLRKPVAPTTDIWQHYNHDAVGTALSSDQVVAPPRFVKWTSGNSDAHDDAKGSPGFRADKGRVIYAMRSGTLNGSFVFARDAFNGTKLWERKHTTTIGLGDADHFLTLIGDTLFTIPGPAGPVEAWDAATGKTLKQYTEIPMTAPDMTGYGGVSAINNLEILYADGMLIVAYGRNLHVVNPTSGAVIWSKTLPERKFWKFVSAVKEINGLFVVQSSGPAVYDRWAIVEKAEAIVYFNLKTGVEIWRNTQVKDWAIGHLAYTGGYLAVHSGYAIGSAGSDTWKGAYSGDDNPKVGSIRVADNELLWQFTPERSYNIESYAMFVKDGRLIYNDQASLFVTDLATGKRSKWRVSGFSDPNSNGPGNQRCTRGFATTKYLFYGFGTWVEDHTFNWYYKAVRRGGCAARPTPAYGMTYYETQQCGCFRGVDGGDGFMAMSAETGNQVVSDETRFQPSGSNPGWAYQDKPSDPVSTHVLRKQAAIGETLSDESPIVSDWPEVRQRSLARAAVTALYGQFTVQVLPSRLQVRVFEQGVPKFSIVTRGRVSIPPVSDGRNVYVGSSDGYVYATSLSDGASVWEFLAAPYDRRIVSASQLESTWPVARLSVENGQLTVTSGRTGAIAGGIFEYAIEAQTGRIISKKRYVEQPGGFAGKGDATVEEVAPEGQPFDLWKPGVLEGKLVEECRYRYRVMDGRGRVVAAGLAQSDALHEIRGRFAPGVVLIQLEPVGRREGARTVRVVKIGM